MAVPGSVVGVGKLITPGGQQGVKGDPGSLANFANQRVYFDDFLGIGPATSIPIVSSGSYFGAMPWQLTTSGAGAAVAFDDSYATGAAAAFGCIDLSTGSTNAGWGQIIGAALWPGKGSLELDFRVLGNTTPTAAQNYSLIFGLLDPVAAVRGIFFSTAFSSGSANTVGSVNNGSVSSTASVPFAGGAFNRYQIVVNAAWTSVSFYKNGTQVGAALTTNIPVATALAPVMFIQKTAGTTSTWFAVDQFYINYQYTS